MIIFLYGSDSYRLKQAREELVSRYKAKYTSGINLFSFDLAEDYNLEELEKSLKTASFFQEHKLIICRNILGKKATIDYFLNLLEAHQLKNDKDITLLIAENISEKEVSAKFRKLITELNSSANITESLEPLEGTKLINWINKELVSRKCSIGLPAINSLINLVGKDSQMIINEIEKLSAYKYSGEITAADIMNLVSVKNNLNIFNLIDVMGNKNKIKAFELLYQELKAGRDPYYILTMFVGQIRNLLVVKDFKEKGLSQADITRKTSLHPFVVRKIYKNVDKFNFEEIKALFRRINEVDINFKSGKISLEDYLYTLC